MNVSTPYRFVPLSPVLLLPDWAPQVSHDHPFADGVCGELQVSLQCHTDLCVGGKQDPSSDHAPGKVHFHRSPDGQPAIPGSSLKGMLRNVLEIASFARFKQVEDQRLGVRDISDSNNFYCTTITKVPAKAGWLRFVDGAWSITPCQYSRLHQEELIKHCGISVDNWCKAATARQRYKLMGQLPPVRVKTEAHKTKGLVATPDVDGPVNGHIVVTGQPGRAFNQGVRSKKYEFVFHAPEQGQSPADALPVSDVVMRGFQHVHQDSDEWAYWREQLNCGQLEHGIPVFFHLDKAGVGSLGLALMYKLPYTHSLHQAIAHTSPAHLQGDAPDLPELLFGRIDETSDNSLRGRIAFGLGQSDGALGTGWHGPTVLSSPKPTFYPTYVRQDNDKAYNQLMTGRSELSGWKRYPARPVDVLPPPDKSGNKSRITLEAVPEDSRFTFTLRVHNLRPVELGALLWALDFGGDPDLRHGLGLGKPFGLGQVSLQLQDWALQPNDPATDATTLDRDWLHACRLAFVALMEQLFVRAQAGRWQDSGPIKALLDSARPARNTLGLEYLPTPKDYQNLKHSDHLPDVRSELHGCSPATPTAADFNIQQTQPLTAGLDKYQAQVRVDRQAAEDKRQREEALAAATPQRALLIQLKAYLKQLDDNGPGKTVLGHINDQLRKILEQHDTLGDDEKQCLSKLLERCKAIGDKKISKACKKLEREAGNAT